MVNHDKSKKTHEFVNHVNNYKSAGFLCCIPIVNAFNHEANDPTTHWHGLNISPLLTVLRSFMRRKQIRRYDLVDATLQPKITQGQINPRLIPKVRSFMVDATLQSKMPIFQQPIFQDPAVKFNPFLLVNHQLFSWPNWWWLMNMDPHLIFNCPFW